MTRRSQACSAERMERWLRRAGMRLGWLASKSTSDQSDDFVRFVSERAPRAACGRPESLRHGSCVPPTSGRLEPFGGHNHGPEGSDPSTRAFNPGPPGSTNPVRNAQAIPRYTRLPLQLPEREEWPCWRRCLQASGDGGKTP